MLNFWRRPCYPPTYRSLAGIAGNGTKHTYVHDAEEEDVAPDRSRLPKGTRRMRHPLWIPHPLPASCSTLSRDLRLGPNGRMATDDDFELQLQEPMSSQEPGSPAPFIKRRLSMASGMTVEAPASS